MKKFLRIIKLIFLLQFHILFSNFQEEIDRIIPGAESIHEYISMIENKKIGIVSNSSSIIKTKNKHVHLLDTLI